MSSGLSCEYNVAVRNVQRSLFEEAYSQEHFIMWITGWTELITVLKQSSALTTSITYNLPNLWSMLCKLSGINLDFPKIKKRKTFILIPGNTQNSKQKCALKLLISTKMAKVFLLVHSGNKSEFPDQKTKQNGPQERTHPSLAFRTRYKVGVKAERNVHFF